MTMDESLFPALMGPAWAMLAPPVRHAHGGRDSVALRGRADVVGVDHWAARLLRRLLGLPAPGPAQPLVVEIVRDDSGEYWTRRFAGGVMRSRLSAGPGRLLHERLGPVSLRFFLEPDRGAILWQLRGARLFGLPLPLRWLGHVLARSGSDGDRYAFTVEASLPGIGRWIGYRGTLEIDDGT
jgi:hypothetical protein